MSITPTYAIRAIAFANGRPCPHAGQWLMSFDHEAYDGLGFGEFTHLPELAKHFTTFEEATEFWRKPSLTKPLRDDGQPNRPLTSLTISIEVLHWNVHPNRRPL